jgi:hypothetical protein
MIITIEVEDFYWNNIVKELSFVHHEINVGAEGLYRKITIESYCHKLLYNIAHFCTEESPFVHRWRNIVAKLPPKTYVPLKNCWIWRFVWKNTLQGKKARRQGETPCTYWFGSPFGVHITDSKWWGDVHRNLVHQLTRRLLARPFDQSIDRSDILNTLDLVRAWSLVNSRGLVGD